MELACSASLLRVNRERAHSPPGALSPVFCIGYACEFVLCRNSFAIRKVPETKPVRAVTTTAAVVLLITPKATAETLRSVSYTHLRAHETGRNLVCRLLLEKKK